MLNAHSYSLNIVVAVDEAGGFTKDKKIPWDIPEDMKHFKSVTDGGICIMGRGTYKDMVSMMSDRGIEIGDDILPGRKSFVITSQPDIDFDGATNAQGITEALNTLETGEQRDVFVIGGRRLFIEAIGRGARVHMTIIKGLYDCDDFFPIELLNTGYKITSGEETESCYYVTYDALPPRRTRQEQDPHEAIRAMFGGQGVQFVRFN